MIIIEGGGDAVNNEARTRIVERATATLPQHAQAALFTVSGRVLVTHIIGEVTVAIQAQSTVLKLVSAPTVGADVDLCAALETNNDAIGTLYNITGTLANAMVATTSGACIAQASPILVTAGTIDLDSDDDDSTGSVKWTLHYVPLDNGSRVVVA